MENLKNVLKKNDLVIIESTIPPVLLKKFIKNIIFIKK